jgi:flagellum-specific ATP synthase
MPLGETHGIHPGSEVISLGAPLQAPVGEGLMGRVIDGLGHPLDDLGPIESTQTVSLNTLPPHPLKRQRIQQPFSTGIKALDTFVPCGRGQRLGIFAGSGVGKSTLLGMIASRAESDVNVIALIGERGREVREFLEKDLDEAGRRKSVVIVATSNQPALARLRGAFLAMAGAITSSIVTQRVAPAERAAPVRAIGDRVMTDYILPLEVVGLLLTAALIGAVIIAMQDRKAKS